MINDDGDIIRGLGFVALHAAYLEESIDDLLNLLNKVESFEHHYITWPIDRKIKQAKKKIREFEFPIARELEDLLKSCKAQLLWRNEIIHGRIYGGHKKPRLMSGRPNVPTRYVESSELYELSNNLESLTTEMYRFTQFDLPREILLNGL